MADLQRWAKMNAISPKPQIEELGAGVFVRTRNVESRLQEEDFHRAFSEPVIVWISPGDYREEKMDALLDVSKRFYAVGRFRFPNVSVPSRIVGRIRNEFPTAQLEGVR